MDSFLARFFSILSWFRYIVGRVALEAPSASGFGKPATRWEKKFETPNRRLREKRPAFQLIGSTLWKGCGWDMVIIDEGPGSGKHGRRFMNKVLQKHIDIVKKHCKMTI